MQRHDHRDEQRRRAANIDQGHPGGQPVVLDETGAAISPGSSPSSVEQRPDLLQATRRPGGRIRSESVAGSRPRQPGARAARTASSSAVECSTANGASSPASTAARPASSRALSASSVRRRSTSHCPSPRMRTITTAPVLAARPARLRLARRPCRVGLRRRLRSSACGAAAELPPSAAASSGSTSEPDDSAVELAVDVVAAAERQLVVERAGGDQLVDRAGAGLHLRGLVLGPLDGQADVAHLLGDAGERLVDPGLRLGGGVGRLERLLLGAEGLDLGLQPLGGEGELLLLAPAAARAGSAGR